MPRSIQLNARGELTHLLSTEGLPKAVLLGILDHANDFLDLDRMQVRNADHFASDDAKVQVCVAQISLCLLSSHV
jgi:hypothetical protein